MTDESAVQFDINDEINRYFDDSSIVSAGQPEIVIVMGGVAVGKTTIRKQHFATGYVVVDSVEIFLSLCRGEHFDFPGPIEELMEIVGGLVAKRAITERRNIVTEIVGSDYESTKELIDAMNLAGYLVNGQMVECDPEAAMKRNLNRGDDCVSAYYAEKYQHKWLVGAAGSAAVA